MDKLYSYTLGFNDGSADGCHETGGGSQKQIEALVNTRVPGAYFQEEPDGRILIYLNERDAKDEAKAIGTVTLVLERRGDSLLPV